MKVSNQSEIQKIYQEQLNKTRKSESGGEFNKVMQSTQQASQGPAKTFHPPSGVNLANPVFQGKPAAAADPLETLKFAAEVVASEPEIRQDRIDRIKKLIDSGQYNVPAEAVAERIFNSGAVTKSWDA